MNHDSGRFKGDVSFQSFKAMVAEYLGVDRDSVTDTALFVEDLGIDSLSLMNFIIRLETEYKIDCAMDTLWTIKNVGDAYRVFFREKDPSKAPENGEESINKVKAVLNEN